MISCSLIYGSVMTSPLWGVEGIRGLLSFLCMYFGGEYFKGYNELGCKLKSKLLGLGSGSIGVVPIVSV